MELERLEPPAWQLELAGKGLGELELLLGLLELQENLEQPNH